jgi:hypothetical protein
MSYKIKNDLQKYRLSERIPDYYEFPNKNSTKFEFDIRDYKLVNYLFQLFQTEKRGQKIDNTIGDTLENAVTKKSFFGYFLKK